MRCMPSSTRTQSSRGIDARCLTVFCTESCAHSQACMQVQQRVHKQHTHTHVLAGSGKHANIATHTHKHSRTQTDTHTNTRTHAHTHAPTHTHLPNTQFALQLLDRACDGLAQPRGHSARTPQIALLILPQTQRRITAACGACARTHARMRRVCAHARTHAPACTHTRMLARTHARTHKYTYTRTHAYTRMHAHTHARTHARTNTHTHARTDMHTHARTHIRTTERAIKVFAGRLH